jgi:hypothetical protein
VFVTNKKASKLYLKKKAASNLYVAKAGAPRPTVAGIAAGTAPFSASAATTGYIPSAFTSFATKAEVSSAVITFSGQGTCTATKPGPDKACPVQILVDGQAIGKVNFLTATAASGTRPDRQHDRADGRADQRRSHDRRPARGGERRRLRAEKLEPRRRGNSPARRTAPAGRHQRLGQRLEIAR